jgi:sec-independent protein translocase protein TatA
MLKIPMMLSGIGGLGPWELIIVLAIVMVVFGAGKLPNVGSSLGEAIKNFKKGMKEHDAEESSKKTEKPGEKENK